MNELSVTNRNALPLTGRFKRTTTGELVTPQHQGLSDSVDANSSPATSHRSLIVQDLAGLPHGLRRDCMLRALMHAVRDDDYAVGAAYGIQDPEFRAALARNTKSNRVHFAIALTNDDLHVAHAILDASNNPKVVSLVQTLATHSDVKHQLLADSLSDEADRRIGMSEAAASTTPQNVPHAQHLAHTATQERLMANQLIRCSDNAVDKAAEFQDLAEAANTNIVLSNASRASDDQFGENTWPYLLKTYHAVSPHQG